MKTRSYILGGILTAALVAFSSLTACASTLVNVDFTGYSDGGLIGQDGWASINNWGDLTVTKGIGAANPTDGDRGGSKALSLRSFSSTDTLTGTARFYSVATSNIVAGLVDSNQSAANWLPGTGIANNGDGKARAYFRDVVAGVYGEHYGDSLTTGHTYDIRMNIDLATVGGLATVSYRDITASQTAFTEDGSLKNIAMGLTRDSQGKYDFDALALRISATGSGISQFTLADSTVPEPSAIVLCITGLIGLVAYAWRKRNA